MDRPHRRALLGTALVGAVVAAGLVVSPDRAIGLASSLAADPVAFSGVVVALYCVRPLFAWPGTAISVLVGYGLGPVGAPLALAGVVLTSLPPFYAARWFGRGDAFGRSSAYAERYFATAGELRGVTAGRLAPIPADAVTAAAGLSEVSLRALVAGTVVGEIPWTVAAVLVGASAARVSTGGLGAVGVPLAVATGVAAAVLLAGPAWSVLGRR